MTQDKIGQEVSLGDMMIFSSGKDVSIYEVLKIREGRIPEHNEVFVNVGASKKWKYAVDGIKR